MNYDTIFLPSVDRLSKLVRHRYGCDFEYEPFTESAKSSLTPLRHDLLKGMPICAGDWVFFPIFIGDELAGAARVSNRDHFSKQDMMYLHQIIRLVLESSLNNVERLDILEEFENHLADERRVSDDPMMRAMEKKVVPLVSRQKNPFPLPKAQEVTGSLNFPFLIEGPSTVDVHKMAVEIHSRTSRYAFLHMHLINPEVFTSVASIIALGPITIFVEELAALSADQKNQITSYYKSTERPKDGPQFIAGTTTPVTELKQQSISTSSLVSTLMIGYLCMTHPFEIYKRENLLDFFYDSLTGRGPTSPRDQ